MNEPILPGWKALNPGKLVCVKYDVYCEGHSRPGLVSPGSGDLRLS